MPYRIVESDLNQQETTIINTHINNSPKESSLVEKKSHKHNTSPVVTDMLLEVPANSSSVVSSSDTNKGIDALSSSTSSNLAVAESNVKKRLIKDFKENMIFSIFQWIQKLLDSLAFKIKLK